MAFRRRTKSYPLFSQEFVIHNHADIGFCLVLCVLIGLMFEVFTCGPGFIPVGVFYHQPLFKYELKG
ncbi:translocating chain-associated membrane protein 2 [Cricetulus griseus]|uniref:Translocating chain-associated membrane protein 2 n=1 Tax=Cricetulus griseus TaxID=10029 RepID=A0A061IPL4_CRIGR|nr:translocating chain-associated membrane protein 2 [Cricetulus griseus]